MEKKTASVWFLYLVFFLVAFLQPARGAPRAHTINVTCARELEHNQTIYVPNFLATMDSINQQIRSSGFGMAETGSPGPDKSYGLGQCYGDLSLLDCALCYAEARTILPKCYPSNGGRIFLDGCFMRAENYSFFQEYKGPEDTIVCGNVTRKNDTFQEAVRQGLRNAIDLATGNGRGFARGRVPLSDSSAGSVYILANCWKTLNATNCRTCLESASREVSRCSPASDGRALHTGCFLRYSDQNFLNKKPSGRSRASVIVIVISVVSSVILCLVGLAIGVYVLRNRYIQKKRRGSNDAKKLAKMLKDSSLNFKYSTLEKATGSFDEANKLGQGGFGTVYKGVLPDGREIAVKRLFFNNRHRAADFYNEVNIISSVDHKNLVRLLGCSCAGPESLLVYEFLPNTSLDRFIFDANRGKSLSWEKRFEIIVGTAEGLEYLHEKSSVKIIHRDIKTSNVLLDSKFRAKLADFGLVRSFEEDQSHISTAVAGTLGYMAPEYLAHGQLTEKADVYSFGVLILEIVTGKANNRGKSSDFTDGLVSDTWKHFQLGRTDLLYDPNLLLENCPNTMNEVHRVVHIGLLCTQEIPTLRPPMSRILKMLTREEVQLPPPSTPPFMDEDTMEFQDFSGDQYNTRDSAAAASLAHVSVSSVYGR